MGKLYKLEILNFSQKLNEKSYKLTLHFLSINEQIMSLSHLLHFVIVYKF